MYIAIIDYGMGNIKSVENAFKKLGGDARITDNKRIINNAHALVLPGVGAIGDALRNLEKKSIAGVIKENVKKKPFLGICLGMQMLFEYSHENGENKGLGLFKGHVDRIPLPVKVPHIGWNQLKILKKDSKIFSGIREGEYFYFVHSYHAIPEDRKIISCTTDYGIQLISGIEYDNIYGLQFHPEKSSNCGLKLLKNFSDMIKEKS